MKNIIEMYRKAKEWITNAWRKLKSWVKGVAIAILSILGIYSAVAQEVTISCTAPTQYIDNTPIDAGETKIFTVYRDSEAPVEVSDVCSLKQEIGPGTYAYSVTVTINGVESPRSNVITKVIEFPQPQAPVLDSVD